MNSGKRIPALSNEDGSPPGEQCSEARIWLYDHYGDPHIVASRFFGDLPNGRINRDDFDLATDERNLSHAKNCEACQAWIRCYVGEKIMARQHRLAQYCCAQLFAAVEEDKSGRLKIQLEFYSPPHYEGAHNWVFKVLSEPKPKGSLLINYCPFCGERIRVAR